MTQGQALDLAARDRRFWLGVIASVLWVAACVALGFQKWSELWAMAPNAWGDFLAGCCSPLAFLWLVLGYLQQGEELKLSTRALLLQAEELRNSVQQQRDLVEVSRLQLEGEREALQQERAIRDEATKPRFFVSAGGGTFVGSGRSTYHFVLSNSGHMATSVIVTLCIGDEPARVLRKEPVCDRGARLAIDIQLDHPLEGEENLLHVEFVDGAARTGMTSFLLTRASVHPHSDLIYSPVPGS